MAHITRLSPDQTLEIRQRVLWPDLPLAQLAVAGDLDALHLGTWLDDRLVGVASFFPDGPTARLRKLAVLPEHQGHGLGAALVRDGIARLRQTGIRTLWCDARETAIPFYTRLGFAIDGAAFDKSGIAYRRATVSLR